ncbi:uncharacterized protein LOC120332591 [Styela clava]
MKVLMAGLFKTGTKSMDEAMRILGYRPAEHGVYFGELYEDWNKFYSGKGTSDDIRRMFKNYDTASDFMAALHWKEFLKGFPDIKIILMQRDIESWLVSYKAQVKKFNESALSFPLSVFSPTARRWFDFTGKFMRRLWNEKENTAFYFRKTLPLLDDDRARKLYKDHTADVIKEAPPGQLLVYNVNEGWGPICKFLGREVPDIPFPHLNKKGEIAEKRLKNDSYIKNMYIEMYTVLALIFLFFSLFVAIVLKLYHEFI